MAKDATQSTLGNAAPSNPASNSADPALAEAQAKAMLEAELEAEQTDVDDGTARTNAGADIENFIATSTFNPGGQKWAQTMVAGKDAGWSTRLGTLIGAAEGYTEVTKYVQQANGELTSIWFSGEFEAILDATGEVIVAPVCILPKKYAGMLKSALDARDDKTQRLMFNIVVSLKATGKAIPYTFGVRDFNYRSSLEQLRDERDRRERRIAADKRKAIEAPKA
jgi:hypothetical protein